MWKEYTAEFIGTAILVFVGCPLDYPELIRKRLGHGVAGYRRMLVNVEASNPNNTKQIKTIKEIIRVYKREFDHFNDPKLRK